MKLILCLSLNLLNKLRKAIISDIQKPQMSQNRSDFQMCLKKVSAFFIYLCSWKRISYTEIFYTSLKKVKCFQRAIIRFCLFFSSSFFFYQGLLSQVFKYFHSTFTVLQGKGEGISLTLHSHFHPLHRYLDINQAITAESSPLHIISSRTRTRNFWFPSASC